MKNEELWWLNHDICSKTRRACTVSFTSWTRTALAPFIAAYITIARLPAMSLPGVFSPVSFFTIRLRLADQDPSLLREFRNRTKKLDILIPRRVESDHWIDITE